MFSGNYLLASLTTISTAKPVIVRSFRVKDYQKSLAEKIGQAEPQTKKLHPDFRLTPYATVRRFRYHFWNVGRIQTVSWLSGWPTKMICWLANNRIMNDEIRSTAHESPNAKWRCPASRRALSRLESPRHTNAGFGPAVVVLQDATSGPAAGRRSARSHSSSPVIRPQPMLGQFACAAVPTVSRERRESFSMATVTDPWW